MLWLSNAQDAAPHLGQLGGAREDLDDQGWFQGLAGFGCTFLELIPGMKRSKRPWTEYEQDRKGRGIARAQGWLRKGGGVGFLPMAPLWILDADSTPEVERIEDLLLGAEIVPLLVRTPGGGSHFYFRLPDDFKRAGLKNHLCHPYDDDGCKMAADFKFGPRSLLVAPWTARNGKIYQPSSPWRPPPVVDPCLFLPNGKFWRVERQFITCDRPERDRIARAIEYLKRAAPVSISGNGGSRALRTVTAHIVRFLGLDPALAYHLLTSGNRPWNGRCAYQNGCPYPWDRNDLYGACEAAVDAIPWAGVKAWERLQATMARRERLAMMVSILEESRTLPGSVRVAVGQVLESFEWLGLPDLTAIALGDELVLQGIPRVLATRERVTCVPGLDLPLMEERILEKPWLQEKMVKAQNEECPLLKAVALMKQVDSLPKDARAVESEASTIHLDLCVGAKQPNLGTRVWV